MEVGIANRLRVALEYFVDCCGVEGTTPVVVEHRGTPAIAPLPVRRADLRTDANGETQVVLTVDG